METPTAKKLSDTGRTEKQKSKTLRTDAQTSPKSLPRLTRWLVLIAYAALIYYLSSQSHPLGNIRMPFVGFDKLVHAGIYALFAGLCAWALEAWPAVKLEILLIALILTTLYGISDEWHQSFVPGREADPMDVLADFTGALLALRLLWWWARRPKGQGEQKSDTQVQKQKPAAE